MIPSDQELRENHTFVHEFESLRKRYGLRDMGDDALRMIADETGSSYDQLRLARHIRNAIAHADAVNRETLTQLGEFLASLGGTNQSPSAPLLPLTGARRSFRVHAWLDERLEQEMIANGFVSIGGSEIGDLTGVDDPEWIRETLTRSMPERAPRAIALFVGYWRRFLWEADAGDLVVLPHRDRTVGIGAFVGPYHFVAHAGEHARHRRAVSWNAVDVSRDLFDPDLVKTLNGQHTVMEFVAPDATARIEQLARG